MLGAGALLVLSSLAHPLRFPLPALPFGFLGGWLDGCDAMLSGASEVLEATVRRGPWALDLVRWLELASTRRPPGWATPHEIVFESPVARLRDFSASSSSAVVPTLVVPPQAGHDSCIVDYSPEQSQMRAIVASGLERALSLDWIGATEQTADASIDDYLDVIDRAVDHCGGLVNLIGDCQGGWLTAIYAALRPERINTLTLAGAPIDFRAGEPVIGEVVSHLAPGRDIRFYEALVAAGGGVLRGRHMLAGFLLIQPGAEISRQFELLLHLDDARQVGRYREFEDWFKHTQDIPGGFYLWIVRHLFCNNALIKGELEVRGQRVELARIDVPLALLAGATDHITPPDQVFALAAVASTLPEHVTRYLSTGGHLGLFMGHEALRDHWPPLLAGVLEHSTAAARPRAGVPPAPG